MHTPNDGPLDVAAETTEKTLKEADEYFAARAHTPAATRARQRIVELYTAWGRPREAEAFR
jgi:tRNA A37 N6-isopentenylltransferase MiaA